MPVKGQMSKGLPYNVKLHMQDTRQNQGGGQRGSGKGDALPPRAFATLQATHTSIACYSAGCLPTAMSAVLTTRVCNYACL